MPLYEVTEEGLGGARRLRSPERAQTRDRGIRVLVGRQCCARSVQDAAQITVSLRARSTPSTGSGSAPGSR